MSEPAWKAANRAHWEARAATILQVCERAMAVSLPSKRRNSGPSMAAASCTCNAISAPTD